MQLKMVVWWLWHLTPTAEALVRYREVKFILLLPWIWRVEKMEKEDHDSADSSRMGEVEGVGTVELVCVGRLLRIGCVSFVIPACGFFGSGEPGSRIGYHRNILLRTNGGRRGRDRKPDFVACGAWIVSKWVVVAWGIESYSGLARNTYFVYLALRMSALGMVQTVRLDKRNTLCCKSRMEFFFIWFYDFLFFICFLLYFMC